MSSLLPCRFPPRPSHHDKKDYDNKRGKEKYTSDGKPVYEDKEKRINNDNNHAGQIYGYSAIQRSHQQILNPHLALKEQEPYFITFDMTAKAIK